jgi:hypothetical protein
MPLTVCDPFGLGVVTTDGSVALAAVDAGLTVTAFPALSTSRTGATIVVMPGLADAARASDSVPDVKADARTRMFVAPVTSTWNRPGAVIVDEVRDAPRSLLVAGQ